MKREKSLLLIGLLACSNLFAAIPWKTPEYTLVARAMPLREALDTFGVAQGMSVVMSKQVSGTLSGDFSRLAPQEFLNRLATIHNLTWYYDGAALYVYGAGEIVTALTDLQFMKATDVRQMLVELGLEDARFPLRTASNDEILLVAGPPRYVELIGQMITRADRLKEIRAFNEIDTRVFRLVNTWADDVSLNVTGPESQLQIHGVARLLEEIMSSSIGSKTRDNVGSNRVAGVQGQISDQMASDIRPIIRADNRLNAVIVRDVKSRMPMYERLIADLDRPQRLVEIDITVFEMSRDDALDWQLSLKVQGRNSRNEAAGGMNAENLFTPAALAGMGAAGAYTYLGEKTKVDLSLSALKTKGKARNLSRAALVTLNNMAAEMTDTQSYHARMVGEKVASMEEVSAGTKLGIKPRIVDAPPGATNVPHQVWLTMELQDGGFESVTVDSMPMTRQSTLETQAAIYENESLLLGGYFRDIKEDAGWGIPYLRDIPWIGWLFGGASWRDETVQRLFVLTPRVIDFDYYHSTTQSLLRVQTLNQRDTSEAEALREAIRRDEAARKDREEALLERLEAMDERDKERLRRNRKERDLRKEQREDVREKDAENWDREFKDRKEAYERSRESAETPVPDVPPAPDAPPVTVTPPPAVETPALSEPTPPLPERGEADNGNVSILEKVSDELNQK